MAKHRNAAEREREVRGWTASGLSAQAYAAERGYSRASLTKWAAEARTTEPTFVRVELVPRAQPEVVVEIGGARVRVAAGFDAALLRDVVAALASEAR